MMPKAILVLSGKGGVGKTLISINIALTLLERDVKVGLLDADFSASNSGYFLDIAEAEPLKLNNEKFYPAIYKNGDGSLEIFSIPLLMGEAAVSMLGDQYSQLLRDAVENTVWNAEYLVVDLPAGWHDEWVEAAKIFADSLLGSIVVVQPAHILDAQKALELHKDLELPVLGLIENMSFFKAGAVNYKIFGESIIDELGEAFNVPVFGQIPLAMDIRNQIEQKNPKLTEKYADPINNAVDTILKSEFKKPGFLERLRTKIVSQITNLIVSLTVSVNKNINIADVQQRFGYPGGSIILLNIMDEKMERAIQSVYWMVDSGRLFALEYNGVPDARIDITPKAIKWALLGNHKLSHGYVYTFMDALRLGHMRIYGDRSMVRGAYFIQNVLSMLKDNEEAMETVGPILEVL